MNIRQLLLILLFLIILNALSASAQVCGATLTVSTVIGANFTCPGNGPRINTSNIFLDCGGFSIIGSGSGFGVKADDVSNVTIKNCGIQNFAVGIDVDPSWNVTIENSAFANMPTCVYVNQSDRTLVRNNTFYNCSYAVRVLSGDYNNITDNTINLTGTGVLLELDSRFNTVHDNIIFNMSLFGMNRGIHVQRSHNSTVSDNFIQDGKAGAVFAIHVDRQNVFQAQNNTVCGNTVVNAGPVVMAGTRWNLAEFNNITQSTGMGIWLSERYNEAKNNTVWNCSTHGIELNSGYNNVSGNIVFGNSGHGMLLDFDVNNSVFRNRIYGNSWNGILVDGGIDDHDIINNTIYGNGRSGVVVQGAGGPGTDNWVSGNIIHNNILHGVHFWQESNSFIIGNTIYSNGLSGIFLEDISNSNNVSLNNVLNHTLSINLSNSDNNIIYNNYFDDEPLADAASTGNSWNITKTAGTNIIGGPFFGGNFWAGYNGYDLDGDGLGDTLLPWKGSTVGIFNGGDFHPLVSSSVFMAQAILNSSFGTNFTTENLTCYANASAANATNVTYHGYFFKNNTPQFDILNRSFYNGSSTSNDEAFDVAVDSNNSMIIVGKLDGHWETVKYSSDGTFLWNVSEAASAFTEEARAVTTDSSGNVIVTGNHYIAGNEYAWTIKYDSNGNHIWNRTISGIAPYWQARGYGITTDSNDSVIITGVRQEAGCSVCWDILLAKYDKNGNLQWTRIIDSGSPSDVGESVAVDSQDNIAVTGIFNNNGFIFKYNPAGAQIWNVTNLYPATPDWLYGVDVDSRDNIVVAGLVGSPMNVSVLKYNSSGSQLWNASTGGSNTDRADDVVVDYEDNIITSGYTNSFGVSGNNIYTVKFYANGTKAWQVLGDFGLNERGWGIDTNSWGEPVIGGRQSPNSGGRRMLLAVYRGFFDYNETAGVLTNVSMVNYNLTSVGDLWRCDVHAFDGTVLSRTKRSNDVLIRSPTPSAIQCSRNIPNNFTNCSNLVYFDNITQVRVDCGGAVSAKFNLTNVYDGTTFFVNTTTNSSGSWLVLDNADVYILDSGLWSLNATCDFGFVNGSRTENFTIPFGTITNALILSLSQNVTNGVPFTVSTSIGCSGGECVNITAALDPLNPLANLTQPEGFIQDIYADSEFIYGPSDDHQGGNNDNFLYVWNKTGLGLYAKLPSVTLSRGLQSVYADSQYIYAAGRAGYIYIWDRTDYATPFASVYNFTRPWGLDRIVDLLSDDNYLYAAGHLQSLVYVHNKSHSQFANVLNLTDMAASVQSLAKDNTYLYVGSQDCNIYIYNRSNLLQAPVVLPGPAFPNCQFKSIAVDSNYIYGHGQLSASNWEAFTRVWHVLNQSIALDWSDATLLDSGMAIDAGDLSFFYQGGIDTGWTMNGWLEQWNKTSWSVADRKNFTNLGIKSIFCDDAYLYVGTQIDPWANPNGSIMLFNNPCLGPVPPVPITINSVSINPSTFPVTTSNVKCVANVTTPGTVANVTFNITFPDGSSTLLSSTNIGSIYTSSGFTVSTASNHTCTVNANNTNGTLASSSLPFFGGHKGIVPMNAGSPFYTTSQNPRNGSHQACLNSLIPGQICNSTWSVVPNGNPGDTWAFFTIYEGSSLNTNRINITILGGPVPPPPVPSGGGGGGSATRALQQVQQEELVLAECIENWICDDWSDCVFGKKSRFCIDLNACGTFARKPAESAGCVERLLEEPSAVAKFVEDAKKEVPGVPVIVESPEETGVARFLTSRNFVRAALLVVFFAALLYLVYLARFLRVRKIVPKRSVLKEEDFKAAVSVKAVPVQAMPEQAASKPKKTVEKLPEDTEGLLKALDKL